MVREFQDVSIEKNLELSPKREIYFCIKFVPRVVAVSKAPYQIIISELIELKIQLQELLSKGYNRYVFPPWGAPVLFI